MPLGTDRQPRFHLFARLELPAVFRKPELRCDFRVNKGLEDIATGLRMSMPVFAIGTLLS